MVIVPDTIVGKPVTMVTIMDDSYGTVLVVKDSIAVTITDTAKTSKTAYTVEGDTVKITEITPSTSRPWDYLQLPHSISFLGNL